MSGSVGGAGSAIGGLLASFVFFVVTQIAPGDAFDAWGWRLMFLSGILTSIVGVLLFRGLEESPAFVALEKAKAARRVGAPSPLRQLFARPYAAVFAVNVILTTGAGAGYYLTSGYLPTFLKLVNRIPDETTSLLLIVGNLAAAAGAIGFGALSQVVGRRPVLLGSGVLRVIAFPVLFLAMGATRDASTLLLYVVALTFIANGSYGPILIFLNERFPTGLRASGTGVSWNVGFAVGGMMPTFVSVFAAGPESLPMLLAIFSTAFSVLYVIGALLIPETKGNLEKA
jgi:MFS family permease